VDAGPGALDVGWAAGAATVGELGGWAWCPDAGTQVVQAADP
jgi:hypothetical protein